MYQVYALYTGKNIDIVMLALFVIVVALMFVGVTGFSLGERRIPVQYAGRVVGTKQYKGQSTHIPVGISSSAVISIIFAMSVMQFPATLAQFFPNVAWIKWLTEGAYSPFKTNTIIYALIYAVLVLFFSWFYTNITFKPDEMAENMAKSGGYVAGIRPGVATAKYLERILDRVSIVGGIFAAAIAIFPIVLEGYTSFKGLAFGGTMLFIMIGVAMDTMKQLESQLVMRHYQGFLK
jgi:preprotein translocase subunit SecY